jgi:hypothetical protein
MYIGRELYVDDLLIYADTFPDYLQRLEEVFERFRKHKITVNPTKCEFGLQEVEYVGYTINSKGYTLSDAKREAVFQIPFPKMGKHLKSFVGVAGHFQAFIPDFQEKIRPLQPNAS